MTQLCDTEGITSSLPGTAPRMPGGGISIWPLTAQPAVSIGGVSLAEIAGRFGTPADVLDEEHVRFRCREYRTAMAPHEVAYAGNAFWCRGMARWVAEEGLSLDACSEGELLVAAATGFPAERILLRGTGKTPRELAAALDYGVGRIVIDSPGEVAQIAALADQRQRVLVRVIPELDAPARQARPASAEDQEFGLSIASGAAADVAHRIARQPSLELAGADCHLGSQITSLDGYEAAARRLVAFAASLGGLPELSLGGGHAALSRPSAHGRAVTAFARRITSAIEQECAVHGIPVPRITIEPGGAIVGSAGVTLYRVLTVHHGARPVVVVDGGSSGSPQPVLSAGRHHAERVGDPAAGDRRAMAVIGRHGAGDVIVPEAWLPGDLRPGQLLAVPGTGACHHAMASDYDYSTRPPVIAVRDGRAWPLIRRETDEDLLRRDVG